MRHPASIWIAFLIPAALLALSLRELDQQKAKLSSCSLELANFESGPLRKQLYAGEWLSSVIAASNQFSSSNYTVFNMSAFGVGQREVSCAPISPDKCTQPRVWLSPSESN